MTRIYWKSVKSCKDCPHVRLVLGSGDRPSHYVCCNILSDLRNIENPDVIKDDCPLDRLDDFAEKIKNYEKIDTLSQLLDMHVPRGFEL